MNGVLVGAIRAYQWLLSPWLGNACRFWPTCSEYARQAIERHGAAAGTAIALARLARCRPGTHGGVDPVPECFSLRCRCERHGAAGGLLTSALTHDKDAAGVSAGPRTR